MRCASSRASRSRRRCGATTAPRPPGFDSLAFRQLLARFVAACNAVAYAHSQGIIHRDLKPGNIMLGPFGETLVVDWGLAKDAHSAAAPSPPPEPRDGPEATDAVTADPGEGTQPYDLLGTPVYMSPEQAARDWGRVGPASDVYSLGATLYVLLTGKVPFGDSDLPLEEVRRGTFPPPSRVKPGVPPALEAVCLKAMALKPEDRYSSALELAAEVERWLADEPVHAYPEPFGARAWRWVRRHRTPVTGAAAALLVGALTLGLMAALLASANERERRAAADARQAQDRAEQQEREATAARVRAEDNAREADRQRAAARREADTATAVTGFLTELFQSSDPLALEGPGFRGGPQKAADRPARQLLDQGRERLKVRVRDQPAVRAALLDAVGNVYRSLGLNDQARSLLQEGLDLRQKFLGEDHEDVATSLYHLAWLEQDEGRFAEAVALYRQALALRERHFGRDDLRTAAVMFNLAWAVAHQYERPTQARLEESEQLFREVVRVRRKHLGDRHRDVGYALAGLAILALGRGDVSKGFPLLNEAFAILEQPGVKDLLGGCVLKYVLSTVARRAGRYDEAARLHREVLEQATALLGEEHPLCLLALGDYAGLLRQKGDVAGGEQAIRKALAAARRSPLRYHPAMIEGLVELADHVRQRQDLAEAEQLYREALTVARRNNKQDKVDQVRGKLIELLRSQKRDAEADALK